MSNQNWWVRPARPEEQGSFCDRDSEIHYDNVDKSKALEQQEAAMRRGDGVVEAPYQVSDYGSDVRFNTNLTSADEQSYDYPTRHGPGK